MKEVVEVGFFILLFKFRGIIRSVLYYPWGSFWEARNPFFKRVPQSHPPLTILDLIIVHQAAGEEDHFFFFCEALDVEGEVFDVA